MSPKKPCRLVAYYRVSTEKQGRSGLGLDGQKASVAAYVASSGCVLIGHYIEVETGTKLHIDNRPKLAEAIAHAKRTKAVLLIAVLDRLARNVSFISAMMETGVEFRCADSPNDNKFVLHIKASMAEEEGRKISERTRAALAGAKARGTKLGTNNLTVEGTMKGVAASVAVRAAKKQEAYAHIVPTISAYRAEGMGYGSIAKKLNEMGEESRTGRSWNASQVRRVLIG